MAVFTEMATELVFRWCHFKKAHKGQILFRHTYLRRSFLNFRTAKLINPVELVDHERMFRTDRSSFSFVMYYSSCVDEVLRAFWIIVMTNLHTLIEFVLMLSAFRSKVVHNSLLTINYIEYREVCTSAGWGNDQITVSGCPDKEVASPWQPTLRFSVDCIQVKGYA